MNLPLQKPENLICSMLKINNFRKIQIVYNQKNHISL